jgi:hypothetical protein
VLGNRGTRNRKGLGDLSCRLASSSQQVKHRAAGGIRESVERSLP